MPELTQRELAARLQTILQDHPRGTTLAGEDAAFVLEVVRDYVMCHKLADPPVAVKIRSQPAGPHAEFAAVDEEGVETGFSYRKAARHFLTGRLPRPGRAEVLAAFREAVMVQVLAYKDRKRGRDGLYVCELTGRSCASSEVEVDHHYPSFVAIVEDYCRREGRELLSFVVIPRPEGGYRLADQNEHWGFAAYHREHAVLRLLHKKVHATVTQKGEAAAREIWLDPVRPPEEGGSK